MAEVTKEQVDHLARLCRIALRDEEIASLSSDLKQILTHVDELAQVNTEGYQECSHVSGIENVMRDDVVGDELDTKTFLDNAPDQSGGFIRVPPVIRKGGKGEAK